VLYGVSLFPFSIADVGVDIGVTGAEVDVGVGTIVGVELGEKETGALGTKIKSIRALMIVTLICIERRRPRIVVAGDWAIES
jgi:hypothetical protein